MRYLVIYGLFCLSTRLPTCGSEQQNDTQLKNPAGRDVQISLGVQFCLLETSRVNV